MLSESERALAIREGHRNAADAAYFNERPHLADDNGIRVFDAGFDRGWDAACAERDARIAELEQQLAEARRQMEAQKDEWLSWEAKRRDLEKDAERLDFIESMGKGVPWIARQSSLGRDYRLHNDKHGTHITARGAIDEAIKEQT